MVNFFAGNELELFLRLLLAAVFGWIISLERETIGKTAGTRTFALVSLGAALFSLSSVGGVQPIAAGIGFLGAGLIIFREGHIEGLTTAAALWAVAALGMILGQGLYVLGTLTALLILLILFLMRIIHPECWKEDKKT